MAMTREYRLPERPPLARLQGDACIVCGRTRGRRGRLEPAGTVRTISGSGVVLTWDVRACPDHRGAR
jgi:hypothetical protein